MLVFARHLAVILSPALLPAVEFSRDIRPILSDRCFRCHGPDESTRMAKLRLDVESAARAVLVPGKPESSKLYQRINAPKPALRMPPQHSGKTLAPREIAMIRTWIEQGAKWQSHWAFEPVVRPQVPAVKHPGWARNEIDRFVLARLGREGLTPSPEATREQWIRRVSFDLTGLPPTLPEVSAFLADTSPSAHETVVDRLLASQSHGEHLATGWLDAARYADTHGYQVDPEKQMWAWRDWVIQVFNRNLPFDQFTIEQIAGDLLPNATLDQRTATGFNRNHRVNTEAGSIAEEFHVENVIDRVSTSGTVWLGLSAGCARCHDHKFDPITMRDFYGLFAIFNNVPEIGTGGPRDGRGNIRPVMKLPAPEIEEQLAGLAAKIKTQQARLKQVEESAGAGHESWEANRTAPEWTVLRPVSLSSENGVTLTALPDGSVLASGAHPERDVYTLTASAAGKGITGFRIELLPDASLPGGGSGRGADGRSMLTQFEVKLDGREVAMNKANADFASPESILDRVIRPRQQLPLGWAVDPQQSQAHYLVVEPRLPLDTAPGQQFSMRISSHQGAGRLIGRFRVSVTSSEFPEPLPSKPLSLREYAAHKTEYRMEAAKLLLLQDQRTAAENRIPSTMVMQEMESPRDAFILARGQYDKPGGKIAPAVPAFLPPLPEGAPRNRLGFARWLVDPENPLTARVAVNRMWQSFFGSGLVATAEDFGSQGSAPSHPELLDWLASEFVRAGWDMKRMHKLIALSAVYRQSSKAAPALLQRDPDNRLLARGPRFRLSAEMIRDQALAVSGLLTERIGGPSVKPYQPAGLWEQLSVIDDRVLYQRSAGPDLWRRSLYTYWKRTVPPPSLTTFDAPTREFCVVKRPLSSTPLQALALLNDETYIEAARKLAERMIREGGGAPGPRIAHGFRLAASRPPSARELALLTAGFERRLTQYQREPAAAEKFLAAGESARDRTIAAPELAAYATAASVILNLDEVVTKQ